MSYWWRAVVIVVLAWPVGSAALQQPSVSEKQPPASEKPTPAPEKKPVIETPSMRLASARNVMIVRTRGSEIPVETIQSTMDGWGRFTLVETRDKADLIVEVASNGDSGVQVSTSTVSPIGGQEQKGSSTRKDLSPTEINMTVFDARNKRPLWSATETVKFAMKGKSKENNLVEAAERLAAKFHQRLEPPAAK